MKEEAIEEDQNQPKETNQMEPSQSMGTPVPINEPKTAEAETPKQTRRGQRQ